MSATRWWLVGCGLYLAAVAAMVAGGQRLAEARLHVSAAAAAPVYQLRIYEIFEHNKAAFPARFRDHAIRIMKKYDFTIRSMWESSFNGRTEFVYLLEWPSEAVMKERWARFMADEEWAPVEGRNVALAPTPRRASCLSTPIGLAVGTGVPFAPRIRSPVLSVSTAAAMCPAPSTSPRGRQASHSPPVTFG